MASEKRPGREAPTAEVDGPPAEGGGDESGSVVDVGLLVAVSPRGDAGELRSFTDRMVGDARMELTSSTDVAWRFHPVEVDPLPHGGTHRASEFVDDAALRITDRGYDLFVVVTDAPLVSHRERRVPGLASPVGRIVVVSTRTLLTGPRGERPRSLDSEAVRWNAATLFVHLVGHVLGCGHTRAGGVMAPFRFDPDRRSVPEFEASVAAELGRVGEEIPDERGSRGTLRTIAFHAGALRRNPGTVLRAVAGSRSLLLPLSLPKLATAAVTPTLILVFSAETWDVGLHLGDVVATAFALVSVLAAAVHLLFVQNLFFPREPGRTVTEHVALVNVSVFLVLLSGMVGLFLLVGTVVLFIELVVFPPDLMTDWPSLEDPTVTIVDLFRTAAFISTLGVLSGALAGGIENRALVRHLALFKDRP